MAKLYGDFGPYLVVMKWKPGWFSAPHSYRTDRIQVVVSGTWWVNSGADFDARQAVPVRAGGFVLRHARTSHYGVPQDGKQAGCDRRLWDRSGRYPAGGSCKAILAACLDTGAASRGRSLFLGTFEALWSFCFRAAGTLASTALE